MGEAYKKGILVSAKKKEAKKPTVNTLEFTYDGNIKKITYSDYDSSIMTISGIDSATNAGTYIFYFILNDKYVWDDGDSNNIYTITWIIKKAENPITVVKASQNGSVNYSTTKSILSYTIPTGGVGTLSYNSTNKNFTVSDNIITIAAGTNAGSYNFNISITAAGDDNYNSKIVTINYTCTIAKITPTLSLSLSSWSFQAKNATQTVTITYTGDGTLSVSSNNSNIAKVSSISNKQFIITSVGTGSCTITVSASAGTNYNSDSKALTASGQVWGTTIKYTNNTTFTVPTGVTKINVWLVGGGGGGGMRGGYSHRNGWLLVGGGGGGAGGYTNFKTITTSAGTQYKCYIGQGGTAGYVYNCSSWTNWDSDYYPLHFYSAVNGGTGGTTYFQYSNGINIFTAAGGGGGVSSSTGGTGSSSRFNHINGTNGGSGGSGGGGGLTTTAFDGYRAGSGGSNGARGGNSTKANGAAWKMYGGTGNTTVSKNIEGTIYCGGGAGSAGNYITNNSYDGYAGSGGTNGGGVNSTPAAGSGGGGGGNDTSHVPLKSKYSTLYAAPGAKGCIIIKY